MAKELTPIDVTHAPELLRLAEEVATTRRPRVLRKDSEDIAVLMPLSPARKRRTNRVKTEADYEAFRSAAGSWRDVDTDKLIEEIYESRSASSRPPVEL